MLSKDDVLKALSAINEPDANKTLTELGMVGNTTVEDGNVTVEIIIPSPDYQRKVKVSHDVKAVIEKLADVKSVDVKLNIKNPQQGEQQNKTPDKQHSQSSKSKPTIKQFAKRYIGVASGKGGVGKSTITANLAVALARMGHKVGVLDADVYGFSIPRMLGVTEQPTAVDNNLVPPRLNDNLQVISMGFFVNEDEPVIWRGPLLHKAITQFMTDVIWDDLDFLLIDLPPGTGDVSITISQALPSAELLVVTTPQATATHVAGRVAKMATRTKLKVIGVIENMSYYENGDQKEYIFGKDGGKQLAQSLNVPLLGEVPLKKSIRESCDNGQPIVTEGNPSEVSLFMDMAEHLVRLGG
ncbi:MAG: hypothetical protein DRP47_07900 [Candidatus Zixiibacteriota bacterium]|nr:MAG: hypothetical protein DRP47_07900 [candidate division Zixibacteria bacterium]